MNMIIYGNHSELYNLINSFDTVLCELIFFLALGRLYKYSHLPMVFKERLDNSKRMTLFSKLFTYTLCMMSFFVLYWVQEKMMPDITFHFLYTWDDTYMGDIFIMPIGVFLVSLIIRIAPSALVDVAGLCASACLVLYKVACSLSGCCYGVEYNGIFYNQSMEQYQVPVQLIELACAVVMLVIVVLLYVFKKMNGKIYPLFMIMYCGSRFVSEFWRGDYPPQYGKLNGYHIQLLIGFALGSLYMLIALIFGKKINAFIQKRNDKFVAYMRAKLPKFQKEKPQLWEFIKYQTAGVVASGFEIIVHMWMLNIIFRELLSSEIQNKFLTSIGIDSVGYFCSFAISTLVGYGIGFVLSKKLVFRSNADTKKSLVKYFFLVIFTVVLSGWIGTVIANYANSINFTGTIEDVLVKLITMIIPIIWVYPANKYVVHRDTLKNS